MADPDRPRFLTPEEIEDIIDSTIPQVRKQVDDKAEPIIAATKESAERIRENQTDILRRMLKSKPLTPKAIPELKKIIISRYNRAKVAPGTPVGITAAESVAAPMTQGALNSFYTAGSAKSAVSGVDQFKALLNVQANVAHASCTIHYKNRFMTFEEGLQTRQELVALPMKDLVVDYDIDIPYVKEEDKWWYNAYIDLYPSVRINKKWVLRLVLNPGIMYNYRITMQTIKEKLEENNVLSCVVSPFRIGIMYIYVDEKFIERFVLELHQKVINPDNIAMLHLDSVVVPSFDKIYFKGIPGIKRLFPASAPVWSIVERETPRYSQEEVDAVNDPDTKDLMTRTWIVALHQGRMISSGINQFNIAKLCEVSGFEVYRVEPTWVGVVVPAPVGNQAVPRPGEIIKKLLEMEKDAAKVYEKSKREQKETLYPRYNSELLTAGTYVFSETNGSNLAEVLTSDLVDPYYTFSNEIMAVYDIFGIEAARNLFIFEFKRVLDSEGHSMDTRHLVLLADFMFNKGRPNSITFRGISRQRTSFLSMITMEQALDTIKKSAFVGRVDPVKSTSATIMMGKRSMIGTGYMNMVLDEEAIKKYEDELKEKMTNEEQVNVDDLEQAVEQAENNTYGVQPATDEDMEDLIFGKVENEEIPAAPKGKVTIVRQPIQDPPTLKPLPVVSQDLAKVAKTLVIPALPEQEEVVTVTQSGGISASSIQNIEIDEEEEEEKKPVKKRVRAPISKKVQDEKVKPISAVEFAKAIL
jgi:hypothetical protein